MALLGHASAEMSLRYGRLFDTTVRAEYERALDLAKHRPAPRATGRTSLPLTDITGGRDWKDTPLLKSRMAGGFCLRAPAQGACTYANICEHCPSYHAEPSSLPILAAQRVDAEALARDAENAAGSPKPTTPTTHRPTRHPDQRGPSRMTNTTHPQPGRTRLRPTPPRRPRRHLHRRRRPHRPRPHHPLPRPHHPRRHRPTPPPQPPTSGTLTGLTDEIATLRAAIDALADTVRRHEEQLRRLNTRKS